MVGRFGAAQVRDCQCYRGTGGAKSLMIAADTSQGSSSPLDGVAGGAGGVAGGAGGVAGGGFARDSATARCAVSWRNRAYAASIPRGTKAWPTTDSPKRTS